MTIVWSILGAVCIIYGILVRMVGSGTRFYLVWLALGVLFFALAVAAYFHLWPRIDPILRKVILIAAGIILAVLVVLLCLVASGFHQEEKKGLDHILVLGAQVYESGPSVVLKYRLDAALDYLEENPETQCIVSGAQGYNEPWTEAEGMADYLIKNGVSEDRIILEKNAKNTVENIRFSEEMIPEGATVGIVTNNFHVFRALQIAKKQGLADANGISAGSTPLYLPNNMLRESLGILKDLCVGNM